ncbi:hypothetical protein XAB3213_1610011 [Xanthomonas citri pv. bilvae]|nr:hypothetical protein XAB3213_1610011 [Xanthomonas citri pv. bilvae]
MLTFCLRVPYAQACGRPRRLLSLAATSLSLSEVKQPHKLLFLLAEAVGFEPTNGCPLLVFKTSAFNHSATLPLDDYSKFQDRCLKPLGHLSDAAARDRRRHRMSRGRPASRGWPGCGRTNILCGSLSQDRSRARILACPGAFCSVAPPPLAGAACRPRMPLGCYTVWSADGV